MADAVTVAIPVRNGGALLGDVLTAVRAQRVDRPIELLVADSGSTDGSRTLAHRYGDGVIDVPSDRFSHGATRNLLIEEASGEHVAFLTQDAVPARRALAGVPPRGLRARTRMSVSFLGPTVPVPRRA